MGGAGLRGRERRNFGARGGWSWVHFRSVGEKKLGVDGSEMGRLGVLNGSDWSLERVGVEWLACRNHVAIMSQLMRS